MADIALEMNHVYKKFKRGQMYDSLRDLVPTFTRNLIKRNTGSALGEREFWAVNDVSFQVKRGEAFGIIGANGAGKSTVLKLLSGVMKPTMGTKVINGSLSALIEVGAGFHQDLTGRENIFLNGVILGMKKEEIRRKFDDIVEFSGLSEWIDTPVKRYSSGMYARLGFAVASHVDPDVLIVDEVLSVGDLAFQNKCMQKMKSIMEGGSTVIFVSHNLKAVSSLCKRCICLSRGKVAASGPTNEVIDYYTASASDGARTSKKREEDIYISEVRVRDENGESRQFRAGQKAWVDVTVECKNRFKNLSVAIAIRDENFNNIFQVATEWAGVGPFSMEEGENRAFTFELSMHLGKGMYYLGVAVLQCDTDRMLDGSFNAAMIFIHSDQEMRGVANLYPKVAMKEA